MLTRPKVIVCMGKPASLAVINSIGKVGIPEGTSMGDIRAMKDLVLQGFGWQIDVFPTWHPAYELRATAMGNPQPNIDMWHDWTKIKNKYFRD
jgi:uracil-DNA glycosylase